MFCLIEKVSTFILSITLYGCLTWKNRIKNVDGAIHYIYSYKYNTSSAEDSLTY